MKKTILTALLSTLLSAQLFADCSVLNFGAPITTQKVKLFGLDEKENIKVVDYQVAYATKGRFYRDENGKLQLKSFNDAYSEFFNYVKETAMEECNKNKYQSIVNLDIKYFIDENNYFFTATFNYIN